MARRARRSRAVGATVEKSELARFVQGSPAPANRTKGGWGRIPKEVDSLVPAICAPLRNEAQDCLASVLHRGDTPLFQCRQQGIVKNIQVANLLTALLTDQQMLLNDRCFILGQAVEAIRFELGFEDVRRRVHKLLSSR